MVSTLHRKLLRDLLRLKGQVFTIALVVAAGIAAFVAMKGNYLALGRARDAFYESARFGDVFVHLERAPETVKADIEALGGVATVDVRVVEGAMIPLESLSEPIHAQVISLPPGGRSTLDELLIVDGHTPTAGRNDEVVLLRSFAESNGLEPGTELAVVMNGVSRRLRVVGVAMSPEFVMAIGGGEMTRDPRRFAVLWMDRAALAAAFDMEGAFNDVVIGLQPNASTEDVIDAVDRVLAPYGGFGAFPRAKQPSNNVIEGELLQMQSMSTVIPAIFLAVAALLLNMVLSRLVYLQRPDIATLKAVGYSSVEIGFHFGGFVLAVSGLGALIGIAAGVWLGGALTEVYGEFFKFPELAFEVDPAATLTALAISFAAAFAGAFGAIQRVMALAPAEAMRPPAPLSYRRTLADRLRLSRLLGPSAQMVFRELERRPLRAAGSSAAIAASVGLLVVAGWYSEGLDALMYTQFHEVMREDVMVVFAEPRPDRAIRELSHQPGVLAAEGVRSTPVRFVNGHKWRDAQLHGWSQGSELRTLRDQFGRPVAIPPDGVVLTNLLGEILGVRVGDQIEVQVREGERPVRHLRVAGFADEGFGLQGHVQKDVLHAWLREAPVVSAGFVRVDPVRAGELDERLKEMPQVISVMKRADVLALFREQSASMIATMTVLITLFGATITIGVVYNNARIALSLRSRDLASLRVLGFHRSEISVILLGELALQVLVALPLGLLFGRLLVGWIASLVDPEQFRFAVIVTSRSYAYAALVAIVAAAMSGLLVRRKLDRLDLIGVLKTRE